MGLLILLLRKDLLSFCYRSPDRTYKYIQGHRQEWTHAHTSKCHTSETKLLFPHAAQTLHFVGCGVQGWADPLAADSWV